MQLPSRIMIHELTTHAFQVAGQPLLNAARNVHTDFREGPLDGTTDHLSFTGLDGTWQPPPFLRLNDSPLVIYRLEQYRVNAQMMRHNGALVRAKYAFVHPSDKMESFTIDRVNETPQHMEDGA